MWRVLREHVEGHERACEGSREKVLQSRKASTAQNMKFSGEKIIAIKSDSLFPYFKANLCFYETLPLINLRHLLWFLYLFKDRDIGDDKITLDQLVDIFRIYEVPLEQLKSHDKNKTVKLLQNHQQFSTRNIQIGFYQIGREDSIHKKLNGMGSKFCINSVKT